MSEEVNRPGRADQTGEDRNRGAMQRNDKDAMAGPGERPFKNKRRRKVSFLTTNKVETVDYKDVATLRRFLNDRGKILASRQTGNTARQQRMISEAIHRAREMALLPFAVTEMTGDRGGYGQRRDRYDRGDRADRGDRGDRGDRAPREQAPAQEAVTAPTAEAAAPEATTE